MPTVPGNPPTPGNVGVGADSPLGAPSGANLLMAKALLSQQSKEQQFTSQRGSDRPKFPAERAKHRLKVVR